MHTLLIYTIFHIFVIFVHGKNGFAERSKILARYRKVILLNYQNNYENAQTSC